MTAEPHRRQRPHWVAFTRFPVEFWTRVWARLIVWQVSGPSRACTHDSRMPICWACSINVGAGVSPYLAGDEPAVRKDGPPS
jgi:hypothetical protein